MKANPQISKRMSALFAVFILAGTWPMPSDAMPKDKVTQKGDQAMINHTVKTLGGETVSLETYRGRSLLIVNTASFCGYTRQYEDLKKLQDEYAAQGFTVLAFPCNDFGAQEPGSPEEIKKFCKARFDVNFPLFEKVHAVGPNKSPLYKTLTEDTAQGIKGDVKWNFTKFLVNKKGEVVARFESGVNPTDSKVRAAIKATLAP